LRRGVRDCRDKVRERDVPVLRDDYDSGRARVARSRAQCRRSEERGAPEVIGAEDRSGSRFGTMKEGRKERSWHFVTK